MDKVQHDLHDGLTLQFDLASAINYAAYHCGLPVVSHLEITNTGSAASKPFTLLLHIPGYSYPWQRPIGALSPAQVLSIPTIPMELPRDVLLGHRERLHHTARLEVKIDDRLLFSEKIKILEPSDWPFDPQFRKVLACFVQPGHPLVEGIVLDALQDLERRGITFSYDRLAKGDQPYKIALIQAVYESAGRLSLYHDLQAPTYARGCQHIRTPEEILVDSGKRGGRGTCIDLVLLLASCLENVHLQPLVIVRTAGTELQHAILGCWTAFRRRYEPVITSYERLEKELTRERIVLLEATGLTAGKRLDFEAAVAEAVKGLGQENFVFALDVTAARRTVTPMQFPMTPAALGIVMASENLARKEGSPELTPRHLLSAMLRERKGTGVSRKLLKAAGARLAWGDRIRVTGGLPVSPRRSAAYRRCLDDAMNIAGAGRLVREEHLLYGVLISNSPEVDDLLRRLGTNRTKVLGMLKDALAPDEPEAAKAMELYAERKNQSPIPTVRVVVTDGDGRVLIIKRRPRQQFAGKWCLPGGRVLFGESLEEAATRKLRDETSLGCASLRFLFYQDSPPLEPGGMHCINLYLECERTGTLKLRQEAGDYAWIGPEDLHRYPLTFHNDSALERYWGVPC